MEWKKMNATWQNSAFANRVLILTNLILVAGIFLLIYALSQKHERIVVVPAGMKTQAAVEWDAADQAYYEAFALYIANLLGQVTASNYQNVLQMAERHMDASIYASVRKRILAIVNDPDWRAAGGAHWFEAKQIFFEKETHRIFITGSLMAAQVSGAPIQTDITAQMIIAMRSGQPTVVEFETYPGHRIKDKSWREQNEKAIRQRAEQTGKSIDEVRALMEEEELKQYKLNSEEEELK